MKSEDKDLPIAGRQGGALETEPSSLTNPAPLTTTAEETGDRKMPGNGLTDEEMDALGAIFPEKLSEEEFDQMVRDDPRMGISPFENPADSPDPLTRARCRTR